MVDTAKERMTVDLGRAVLIIARALDYVGVDDISHGRRVGLMCHRVAHRLEWDQHRRHQALLAGMIHDCGVSSTEVHQKLVDEVEWDGAEEHCERGVEFLKLVPLFEPYQVPILYHHTRWKNLPPSLSAEDADLANLLFLMDRIDVFRAELVAAQESPIHLAHFRDRLIGKVAPFVGTLFDPKLFAAACEAMDRESFWIELEAEFLDAAILETLNDVDHRVDLVFSDIMGLGQMISQVVDAKSPFTHEHSVCVAELVYEVSGLAGLDYRRRLMLRLAALLHDTGKLRTPDYILEKPTELTAGERDQMLRHPLDSKLVLASLFPRTPIARWAAEHHEKLNGCGYPFGRSGAEIDLETRILTISDIFQALSQDRPYRRSLLLPQVIAIMQAMEERGEIDSDIFALFLKHADHFYQIAKGAIKAASWEIACEPSLL